MGHVRKTLDAGFAQKGIGFWVLSPILFVVSLLWAWVASIRRRRGYARFRDLHKSPRVICCGNILVGGTGKSPIVRHIAQDFLSRNNMVAIVARGIGKGIKTGVACSASLQSNAEKCLLNVLSTCDLSDENKEHFEFLTMRFPEARFAVFQGSNRLAAVNAFSALTASCELPFDRSLVILDDGLQHFAAPRHLNLCVWDPAVVQTAPSMCLPVGPYREGFFWSMKPLLEVFSFRVWSRCRSEKFAEFVSQASTVLKRFGMDVGNQDLFVVGEHVWFVANSATSSSLLLCDDVVARVQSCSRALCITGIAHGERFVSELREKFPDGLIDHIELGDHASLSENAICAMSNHETLIFSGKDFFRWRDHEVFAQNARDKNVFVVAMEVSLRARCGDVVSPADLLLSQHSQHLQHLQHS